MDYITLYKKLLILADTPGTDRFNGLRRFNSETWTSLHFADWQCENWNHKVQAINSYFDSINWKIEDPSGTVYHVIHKITEDYLDVPTAKWLFVPIV